MEFLKIFDVASVTECYSRNESVMPQQALALANSELTLRSSRILALALTKKSGSDAKAFIESAFEQVLSRSPSDAEHAECLAFLKERTQTYAKEGPKSLDGPETDGKAPANHPALRARENLVHVLFNHHEFVTIR
jgi:hypothetical protein